MNFHAFVKAERQIVEPCVEIAACSTCVVAALLEAPEVFLVDDLSRGHHLDQTELYHDVHSGVTRGRAMLPEPRAPPNRKIPG